MKAMVLRKARSPLAEMECPAPVPGPRGILLKVDACGVCRTDLHIVDGDLTAPRLPLIPGHEIVGTVVAQGSEAGGWEPGMKAGIPWLGSTCGTCAACVGGRENLCDKALFTGYGIDGGYAEYVVADGRYALPLPRDAVPLNTAPLLCAGLIGYRTLRLAGEAQRIGLYGFGAAAHILVQVAAAQGRTVFAFTRPGDRERQAFARSLGAAWAGDASALPPEPLDAALIFAPVGALVPQALRAVAKGGTVVCGGIHMSEIPAFPYELLWGERSLRSVANLTRQDGEDFFRAIAGLTIRTEIEAFALAEANVALSRLRDGSVRGAAVLDIARGAAVRGFSATQSVFP